jgi:hypothetical protein
MFPGPLLRLEDIGIQCALEVLVRPENPPALRHKCAYLLQNALNKNAHPTWVFVQAGEGRVLEKLFVVFGKIHSCQGDFPSFNWSILLA